MFRNSRITVTKGLFSALLVAQSAIAQVGETPISSNGGKFNGNVALGIVNDRTTIAVGDLDFITKADKMHWL